ncbi:MAG TPA: hypothetical protein PKN32_06960, partial [Bacteroidales bacterium]|nr:hypothetical protein [Bacteroidales bacterium]
MKRIFTTILFIAITLIVNAQWGSNDPTFNPTDYGYGYGDGANDNVFASAIQSDGKIIIGGNFTSFNGINYVRIARLNTDGSLDATFNVGTGTGTVMSIVIQDDGKIIIGGAFTVYNGTSINRVARLNIDGSIDNTFNIGTGANNNVYTIALQSDGKIFIGGEFTSYNGTARNRLARLNSDGSLDVTFNVGTGANMSGFTPSVRSSVIQNDDKIIIGGNFSSYNGTARNNIARLNSDGSLDETFIIGTGANSSVSALSIQNDDKIVIGGFFTSYNGVALNYIGRLNSDGSLDNTFNVGTGASSFVTTTTIQSDGKIIIGGWFTSYNGVERNRIARLNSDGSIDASLSIDAGANDRILTLAIQVDGKIIIGGSFTVYGETAINRIARLNSDGSLDAPFNIGTGANSYIISTAIQNDQKIIIGGGFTSYNGVARSRVARLNIDGSLDDTFDSELGSNDLVYAIYIQNDGKIIIGGSFTTYNGTPINRIARLNSDGSLDPTFNVGAGANNNVLTIAIQNDGKIIIGGEFTSYNGTARNRIARLNTDGTLDGTFAPGTGANNTVNATAIQSDGKIIISGSFTSYNGTARNRIARLNTNGSLDGTFTPGTGANNTVNATAIQSDGKIIISGSFTSYNGTARNRIARLNESGALDATFSIGTGANGTITTTTIQNDNKIIIGGNFTSFNGTVRNRIVRLNNDGSIDATFNIGTGASSTLYSTSIQSDGKIIIGGFFTSYDGIGRNRIARLLNCIPSVTPEISIEISAGTNPTCIGNSVTFTATPTNGGTTPAYQWKVNGTNAGTNSPTFTSTTLTNGDVVTCELTSSEACATGNPATSNNITMSVSDNLPVSVSISANPSGAICSGTSVTFTATPTNGGTTPAYQW